MKDRAKALFFYEKSPIFYDIKKKAENGIIYHHTTKSPWKALQKPQKAKYKGGGIRKSPTQKNRTNTELCGKVVEKSRKKVEKRSLQKKKMGV